MRLFDEHEPTVYRIADNAPSSQRWKPDDSFDDTDADDDTSDAIGPGDSAAVQVPGTRTRRQRRAEHRIGLLTSVGDLHAQLAPEDSESTAVVRPPKGVGRRAKSLWRTLEAQRVREQMGSSRWIRNPPRRLGASGRRQFLQAERAAVRVRMRMESRPGGAYTAQEQQRGALVLALLLTLIPLTYLVLTSCGA